MRKIADLPRTVRCRHPEHNPPNMIVLPPGIYEHECPGCGHKQTVLVDQGPTMSAQDWKGCRGGYASGIRRALAGITC